MSNQIRDLQGAATVSINPVRNTPRANASGDEDRNSDCQAFTNYSFSCTSFRVNKTILCANLCMWEIMHVAEQTYMLLTITCYSSRNCTKIKFKTLCSQKQTLYLSPVYCSFSVDYDISVYMMTTIHFCSLYTTQSIYIAMLPYFKRFSR